MTVACRVLAALLAVLAFAAGATNDDAIVKVCGIGLAAVAFALLGLAERRPSDRE